MTKLYLLLLLMVAGNASCQHPWMAERLNGNVKSVEETSYFMHKAGSKKDWSSHYKEFNKEGVLIKSDDDQAYSNGCNFNRTFDDQGNVTEAHCKRGEHTNWWAYQYDANLNITRSTETQTEIGILDSVVHVFTYDSNSMLIKDSSYHCYSEIELMGPNKSLTEYWYDERGNKIEEKKWYAQSVQDDLVHKWTEYWQYDSLDNITFHYHIAYPGGDTTAQVRYAYQYDSLGRITEGKRLYKDTTENHTYTNIYDQQGNVIHRTSESYEFDSHKNRWVPDKSETDYTYDAFGNLLTDSYTSGKYKWKSTFVYVYDEYGNWIKRTEHKSGDRAGAKTILTERVITYFN